MRLKNKWEADSTQYRRYHLKQMIDSVIYGLAIGDALGVPVEFNARDSYQILDMVGYGTYNQPAGTWSDDTSLSLALIEHLCENSDLNGLMDKFVAYRQGYLTPFGYCFDIGVATNQAIERYLAGVSPEKCGGTSERDNGNGALMRISPLALLLHENFDFSYRSKIIEQYTKLTHAHPRSIVASILYVQFLIGFLLNIRLEKLLCQSKPYFEDYFKKKPEYWKEYQEHFRELFDQDFYQKSREEITSTGYVVDTLKSCLWCLGTTKSFEEAVLKAVNLGEDTDTIGAITGSLAGAIYKLECIPERWIEKLANRSLLEEKCHQLLEYIDK